MPQNVKEEPAIRIIFLPDLLKMLDIGVFQQNPPILTMKSMLRTAMRLGSGADMTSNAIPGKDHLRIHWMTLFLQLPERGIAENFPSVVSCNRRLAEIRWPNGPVCTSCGGDNVGFLSGRQIYYCRDCNYQCSVKAKTLLHRSRLDLRTSFFAAEFIICCHAYGNEWSHLTGHAFADQLGISYVAARRLKKSLVDDLSQPGGGLIGKCLSMRALQRPNEIRENSPEHFFWIYDQLPQPDAL
ncbi:MAG: transposase [Litorimonas sp.]